MAFRRGDDAASPESEWLSEAEIAQVVEERLAQFGHHPPVLIRDSEADDGTVSDAAASGMVRGGKIYLFRDGMADTAEVTRTLWHELLHYGLRRFLTKDQYIATPIGHPYAASGQSSGSICSECLRPEAIAREAREGRVMYQGEIKVRGVKEAAQDAKRKKWQRIRGSPRTHVAQIRTFHHAFKGNVPD